MRSFDIRWSAAALAASVALTGCPASPDDDDDDDDGPFDLAAPDTLGVALLWSTDVWQFLDGGKALAEETAVDAPFPASFELTASSPPGSALFSLEDAYVDPGADPDARIATGYLLGYEDGNANGALDLVTPGDMAFLDTVLGMGTVEIYYLDSTEPLTLEDWYTEDGSGIELQPGPNLVVIGLDGMSVIFELVDPDYDIPLMLLDDPSMSYLLCPDGNHNIASMSGEECTGDEPSPDCPDLGALPPDAEVVCEDDGRALTVTVREEDRVDVCESFTSYTDFTWSLEEGETPPDDWPC